MLGIFRRIASFVSGPRGNTQGGRRKTSPGARSRNGAGGKRRAMVRDSDRTGSVSPARVAKAPRGDFALFDEAAKEISNNVVYENKREDKSTWPPDWDDRSRDEQNVIMGATEQRLALQHAINQEAALLGMQQNQTTSQMANLDRQMGAMNQQMSQLTGMGQDPLQGVPNRNTPYWKAMYGQLGMGGQFLGKGGK